MKYYVCESCGKMIVMATEWDTTVPTVCCGKQMKELVPGTSDGAVEKHVPVVTIEGNQVTVKVGSVEHPMIDTHYIEWIAIETKEGNQMKQLHPGDKPIAVFTLTDTDSFITAYEYCNIHGLWQA
ncbi:MAG: desulfoferrodoxin family protein [Lachnospiraceae bacterium]